MLRPPWRAVVKFADCRKERYAHPADPFTYCCTESQSHYHRLYIYADLYHPGWEGERSVGECIRHEIAHHWFAPINKLLYKYIPEELHEVWDNLEDTSVDAIATMPALGEIDG